jgi:hypothetical protein
LPKNKKMKSWGYIGISHMLVFSSQATHKTQSYKVVEYYPIPHRFTQAKVFLG